MNRYTCTTQNFILASRDLCEQVPFEVFEKLNQEVCVVFLKGENIMKMLLYCAFAMYDRQC